MITDFPCTSMAFSFVGFYEPIKKKEKKMSESVYDVMW